MSEPVTVPESVTPAPTPLEVAVAKPAVNLRELEKLTTGEPSSVSAPEASTVVAPAPETRPRDAQGRFLAGSAAPASAAPSPPSVEAAPAESRESVPAAAPPEPAPEPSEGVKALQKRLGQERAKRGDIERTLLAKVEALERQLIALRIPAKEVIVSPTFPDYEAWLEAHPNETYETYLEARVEARLAPKFTEQLTAQQTRLEGAGQARAQRQALQQIQTLGASRYADFEAVQDAAYEAEIQWAPHVTAFVLGMTDTAEEAVDLTYQLLKDPDLVDRLNELPPARAHFELGRLLAALPTTSTAPAGSAVPSSPVTRAPAPTVPLGGGANLAPSVEDLVKAPQVNLRRLQATLER